MNSKNNNSDLEDPKYYYVTLSQLEENADFRIGFLQYIQLVNTAIENVLRIILSSKVRNENKYLINDILANHSKIISTNKANFIIGRAVL